MSATAIRVSVGRVRCHYRPLILVGAALALVTVFWFTSRYPQLLGKAERLGQAMPSMSYAHEVLPITANSPLWQHILFGAINWLADMRIGMTFGVLFGALLHTYLRYYPLKIGKNLYLNSLKGALVGVPMGVCANCAVPTACGVSRGHGRIEVALGFLFSSPNLNPVVVMMTLLAFPWTMSLVKYVILLLVIVVVVPGLIGWLERKQPIQILTVGAEGEACAIPMPDTDCREPFWSVLTDLAKDMARNVWMLLKPTLTIMLLTSVLAAALQTLVPWQELLSQPTPLKLFLVSLVSVLMPVPIALDVLFAAQLQQQGVAPGYVMLFATTLGTYSIIPSIYLWREVSRRLAVALFIFFVAVGWLVGLIF
jgi:uncharacterized membrane protein YraQ (UPF0718 family)